MASVYVLRNPLDPFERDHHEHEGPLIDLLQDIAPNGFDMPIRAFINGKEIDLSDLDTPVANDDIAAIIVTPGFIAIGAIISAVVSALISVVLSLLFAPKSPSNTEKEDNPTYSINVLRNQTRLGQPLPVVYGSVWTTPDYASRPYRFFSDKNDNWNQYLDMLVCVGAGEFDEIRSDDLKIGNTTLSDTAVVKIKQFHLGPARGGIESHEGSYGKLQTKLWKENFHSGAHIFLEGCYTSPEVDNWEFSGDTSTATSTVTASVEWIESSNEIGAVTHALKMAKADYDAMAQEFSRSVIIATSTLGNTGSYYLAYPGAPDAAGFVTMSILNNASTGSLKTGADTVTIDAQTSTTAKVAGPFWVTPNDDIKTDYIYIDIEAPGGMYQANDKGVLGGIHAVDRKAWKPRFKIEVFDKAGAKVTEAEWLYYNFSPGKSVRKTFGMPINDASGAKLPPDRYQVKVTAMYTFSEETQIQNKTRLTSVRSVLNGYKGKAAYGDCTLLAVRMRATNGIASQSQDQLRVRARRRYKLLDGSIGVSANPADVAADILTNDDYGASQPTDRSGSRVFLKWDMFEDCRKLWEGAKTDPANYPEFNGVFSTSDTVWTALQSSLSTAVAKPIMDQGQVSISRDSIKPYRAFMFNAANIVLDSLTATYTLAPSDDVDHVEVEYRDDELMEPSYAIYPEALDKDNKPTTPGLGRTPQSPHKVKLFGCTDGDYAAKYARLIYNRRLYQRKAVTFSTEMDGMLPTLGDRILVSTPQVRWGISGNVRFAKQTGGNWILTLDALPDWADIATKGKAYIVLTDIEGRVSERVEIVPTLEKDNRVQLNADPTYADGTEFSIDISGSRDPARYSILLESGENARDMEITNIEHQGGTDFTIGAVHYEVKQDNTGHDMFTGVPLHMTKDFDGSDLL